MPCLAETETGAGSFLKNCIDTDQKNYHAAEHFFYFRNKFGL